MTDIPVPAEAPPLDITVTFNGQPKTVKMVYGMEMDLRRLLPDPNAGMQLALMDQFTQDYIVRRVLTDSKKMLSNIDELIPAEDVDLSTEDVERIIAWVLDHLLYFFAKRMSSVAQLGVRFQGALPNLFKTGSPDSPSATPSAGPSESSKEI